MTSHDNLGFTSSTNAVYTRKDSPPDMKVKITHSKGKETPTSNGRNEISSGIYVVELQDKKKKHASVGSETEEYDPYCHREVEHPTTNSETLLHLLKGSLGTGILAMPMAFKNAGYAVGLVGTLAIGLLCTYCIHLLVKSEYELCRRKKVPSLTYPTTAENAFREGPSCFRCFSRSSVHVINVFLLIYQLGCCCVYVVFIADNIKSALEGHVMEIDTRWYMLMLLLPLILINWVRNLKYLVPFSTVANGITFASFGIILYYLFREPLDFEGRAPVGDVQNFPLFFGTVLFALEAIGVILPLENEMKTPKSFGSPCGVLNVGMITVIFLYLGMGFFGYIRYADLIKGSITLNLPDETPAKVAQVLLALAIYVTHALQCYVAVDITWSDYLGPVLEKNSHRLFWEYVMRTCLVVVTFLFAVAIPKLEYFISLIGALSLSGLGLAFPAIIYTCTFWNVTNRTEKIIMIAKNSAVVAFGFLGLIAGTYTSLLQIINYFKSMDVSP
ncbi:proton-coupled amino acid transporter-like protein CG1139 isoform X1 [Neodiprion lecontei]|uniref:Proton-coupled amino acid transporter-like protein CG1139 isoform X1 n=2 Tax=Neodiprion lecontei TaxID=441921 RepID=A0ABM3FGV4_NEOLC|nr:proton-coupled amino acid transporter-like protein CG1139 isoform X1 [Neodiprion lecontei]